MDIVRDTKLVERRINPSFISRQYNIEEDGKDDLGMVRWISPLDIEITLSSSLQLYSNYKITK